MLNEYHLKFLHHLANYQIVFMIIGGQARRLISPDHATRDIDIWVRLQDEDIPRLEQALIAWAREHPQHTNQNMASPLPLRAGVQIAFPESDGVWFLTRAGEPREIGTKERVDVLTSIEGLDFDDCLGRAGAYNVNGLTVHALCKADLDRVGKIRGRR